MYDAWKKKVMQDTTKNYYIDTWFLSQNLPYYRPETLTSFIIRPKGDDLCPYGRTRVVGEKGSGYRLPQWEADKAWES